MTDVAVEMIQKIRDTLWPDGDQEAEWDSSTLDEVARILREGEDPAEHHVPSPPAQKDPSRYFFRVDGKAYGTSHACLTAEEILACAGKSAEEYLLRERNRGTVSQVAMWERQDSPIREFITIKRAQTGG